MTVPIRPAATVVLVRDSADGVEVLMLRRNLESVFVAGAYVFPGGAVEPADGDLGDLDTFRIAAVRECFEECGVLLARDAAGAFPALDEPAAADRFAAHRADLDAGRRSLADLCREERLRPAIDDLRYVSRWLTPEGAPRRYDTRFFVAPAPDRQVPAHDDRETIESLWIRPADALERNRGGRFELILPTLRTLEAVARHARVEDVLRGMAA